MIGLFTALAIAASVPTVQAAAPAQPTAITCPVAGEQAAGALHRRWILEGWERAPGDGRCSFREKLGRFYDWESPDVVLYDDQSGLQAFEYGEITAQGDRIVIVVRGTCPSRPAAATTMSITSAMGRSSA